MNPTIGLPDNHYVRAWMSPPEHQVGVDTKLEDAFETMLREQVRHLLVIEQGELCGVVSDRDLRRPRGQAGRPMSARELFLLASELRVGDVMSERPITIGPDDTVSYAAEMMVENKVSCLPVLDAGRVRGILTSDDLLAALVHRESLDAEEGLGDEDEDAEPRENGAGVDYEAQAVTAAR